MTPMARLAQVTLWLLVAIFISPSKATVMGLAIILGSCLLLVLLAIVITKLILGSIKKSFRL